MIRAMLAIELEGRRLPVFPCYPNKRPACVNGFKDASADRARIADLWGGRTGLLVAVPTGAVSSIAVLDVDRAGLEWTGLAGLPPTRVHQTRSGGRHYIFRHPSGLRCSQSVIAPGIDVRGEGGYVIWWAAHGFAVDNRLVTEWPLELPEAKQRPPINPYPELRPLSPPIDVNVPSTTLDMEVTIFARFKRTVARWSREDSFAYVSANKAQDRITKVPAGRRNHALNGEAYALGRQVARGWLRGDHAVLSLWLGAQACKYVRDHGEAATLAVIRSGLLAGMEVPYQDLQVLEPSVPEGKGEWLKDNT